MPLSPGPGRPRSFLILAGLALVALALGATCGACAGVTFSADGQSPLAKPRTAHEQYLDSVRITVTCAVSPKDFVSTGDETADGLLHALLDEEHKFGGTGVMTTNQRLLTNFHVVACEGPGSTLRKIEVDTGDEKPLPATVEILLPHQDIARLLLEKPLDVTIPTVRIGPAPEIGDKICFAGAIPRYSFRCGTVQPSPKGMIATDFKVEHGCSGSAASDSQGRLVGLVFATITCSDGEFCVGVVTPITPEMNWLVR